MKPIQMFCALSLVIAARRGVPGDDDDQQYRPGRVEQQKRRTGRPKTEADCHAARQMIPAGGHRRRVGQDLARENFNAPVTIRVLALPKGVESRAMEIVIPAGQTSAKLRLTADENAELGEHEVEIDAQAPGLDDNIHTVKLTVREKELVVELPVSTPY